MEFFTNIVILFILLAAALCGAVIGFVIGVESVDVDFPESGPIERPTKWRVKDPALGYESTWTEHQYVLTDLEGDMFEINCNRN